ncbi:MAG: hypothetical protein HQL62_07840, partial [Magnetococcales bacterium]|nr:hypothetical protein [Magnetococcales bacterium]
MSAKNQPEGPAQPPFPFPGMFPPTGFPGFASLGMSEESGVKFDLSELWWGLFKFSWIIVILTAVTGYNAYKDAKGQPYIYRASASIMSASEDTGTAAASSGSSGSGGGGLVGLIGPLSGLLMGDSTGGVIGVANINLRSRTFMVSLIQEENLLPDIYPELWDAVNKKWKDGREPNLIHAFHKLQGMIAIGKDASSGTTSLSVTSTDPKKAAHMANLFVDILNKRLREKAIQESEERLAYLTSQVKVTSYVEIQQAITGLLEVEIKKMMGARLRKEFLFRIIDPAIPPEPNEFIGPNKP